MSADSHILSSISYVQCIDFSATQLKMVHEFGDLRYIITILLQRNILHLHTYNATSAVLFVYT